MDIGAAVTALAVITGAATGILTCIFGFNEELDELGNKILLGLLFTVFTVSTCLAVGYGAQQDKFKQCGDYSAMEYADKRVPYRCQEKV